MLKYHPLNILLLVKYIIVILKLGLINLNTINIFQSIQRLTSAVINQAKTAKCDSNAQSVTKVAEYNFKSVKFAFNLYRLSSAKC